MKKMKTEIKDAKRKLYFEVTDEDTKNAVRHHKNACVIALALHQIPGITAVEVGARITVVVTEDIEKQTRVRTRYQTPNKLKTGLNEYDLTGQWNLPVGVYCLGVPWPCEQRTAINIANEKARAKGRRRHFDSDGNPYPHTGSKTRRAINPRYLVFKRSGV